MSANYHIGIYGKPLLKVSLYTLKYWLSSKMMYQRYTLSSWKQ